TTTGTGSVPGSALSTWDNASGPPVEQPTARTSTRSVRPPRVAGVGVTGRVAAGGGPTGRVGRTGAGAVRRIRHSHSAWIRGTSCSRTIRRDSVMLPTFDGLVT